MHNVILIIHLVLALSLIGVVLLQRSEGGGLGLGGGGGGGVMSGRSAASALSRITWGLAIAFLCTSLALTILAAKESAGASVVDRITDQPEPEAPATDLTGSGEDLLPPTPADGGLVPTLD